MPEIQIPLSPALLNTLRAMTPGDMTPDELAELFVKNGIFNASKPSLTALADGGNSQPVSAL